MHANIFQGHAGVLEFVGHDQPIAVVDPRTFGLGNQFGDGIGVCDLDARLPRAAHAGVEIGEDGDVLVFVAVIARVFVPHMQAIAEEAPGEVAGIVPRLASPHGSHGGIGDGDGFGVGFGGVEPDLRGIGILGGEGGGGGQADREEEREDFGAAHEGVDRFLG